MSIKKERILVFDMTCTSCEARVEKAVSKLEGMTYAKASYTGQHLDVEYDTSVCSISKIKDAVKSAGYSTTKASGDYKVAGIIIIALAIIFLGKSTQGIDMNEMLNGASYLVLFVVGLLTSIHCVGMCGGIMLSQTVNKENSSGVINRLEAIKPALLYNAGRVISYTILGGIIGALGSVLTLTTGMQAAVQIFAAAFMIVMGLNMFGVKAFRKFHVRLPWSVCSVKNRNKAPLVVGLLNGFMPCGPLQTMQLYALGTGSPVKGALSMFLFSLGTVPLMLIFGAASGLLSKGYTKQLLKFSGVFVVILGLIMGRRGLALAGVSVPTPMSVLGGRSISSNGSVGIATIENGVQIINMTADASGYTPNVLYIQKGIPVRWVIDGKQITSCNNEVIIPTLKVRKKLKSGENIVQEFTPVKTGDLNFSCWMGMIPGVFKVVDDLKTVNASTADAGLPPSAGGNCCAADGGAAAPSTPSIYGDDLSKVSTERIVKKALVIGNTQSFNLKGIGYEFDPLIIIVKKDVKAKFTVDLKAFDNPGGEFTVIDGETGDIITSFEGSKDNINFESTFNKLGGYGIIKDNQVYAIIEVVDDVRSADAGQIRGKYLQ